MADGEQDERVCACIADTLDDRLKRKEKEAYLQTIGEGPPGEIVPYLSYLSEAALAGGICITANAIAQ